MLIASMNVGDRLGKYRLTRRIGDGAMGVVWAALNEDTHREVALKVLQSPNDELRRRLLREAKACGRLDHRNIVTIYDVGTTSDGEPFLVMQLLNGETLARRLQRVGRLSPEVAAGIGAATAAGLAAAHDRGIVHRDLKPENIYLHHEPGSPGEVVKILDFGVSRLDLTGDAKSTATGAIIGSPAYMSPEQARGSTGVGPRSDLWSLGVVLFEMLAGVRPFPGQTMADAIAQVLTAPIPSLASLEPHVPTDLAKLVDACLERDPARRPASAAEIAERLSARPVSAPQPSHVSLPSILDDPTEDDQAATNVLDKSSLRGVLIPRSPPANAPRVPVAAAGRTLPLPSAHVEEEEEDDDRRETAPAAPRSGTGRALDAPRSAPSASWMEGTAELPRVPAPSAPTVDTGLPLADPPGAPDLSIRQIAYQNTSVGATASSSTTPLTRSPPNEGSAPIASPRSPRFGPLMLTLLGLSTVTVVIIGVLLVRSLAAPVSGPASAAASTATPPSPPPPPGEPPAASAPAPPASPTADEPQATAKPAEALPTGRPAATTILLNIHTNVPARVFLDDELIGTTPIAPVTVRPGTHKLRFEHTILGNRTTTVRAKAGEPLTIAVDFGKKNGVTIGKGF
jgi:serine/threonine-protein kinase